MEKYLIKQILLEQKEEIERIFKERTIKREAEERAKKMIPSDLIKVIMGARRCGKSVLAHQLLKNEHYGYVNFDDERLIRVKTKDLNDFLEVLKEIDPDFKYLLLDEIQNVEGWELFNYGIHGVEMLYTFMSTGCEFVQSVSTEYGQVVAAKWKDGRLGMVRCYRKGAGGFGFFVIGDRDNLHKIISEKYIYRELLKQVIKMFEKGTLPLDNRVTLEIINFIECAQHSSRDGERIYLDKNISGYL